MHILPAIHLLGSPIVFASPITIIATAGSMVMIEPISSLMEWIKPISDSLPNHHIISPTCFELCIPNQIAISDSLICAGIVQVVGLCKHQNGVLMLAIDIQLEL